MATRVILLLLKKFLCLFKMCKSKKVTKHGCLYIAGSGFYPTFAAPLYKAGNAHIYFNTGA